MDKISGLLVFVLAIGGFRVGLWIVKLAHAENGSDFTSTPQFRVWSAMAGALVALAAVIFLYSAAILRTLRARFCEDAGLARLTAVYLVFAGLIFWVTMIFGSPDTSRVADYNMPRIFFLLLGLVVSAPSIMGIWLIGLALIRKKDQTKQLSPTSQGHSGASAHCDLPERKQVLCGLMLARIKLLALLSAVGSLIGVTVLTTGALRNALLAVKAADGKAVEYPIEYVLIYGLFFSALLAAVYAPVYFRLQDASRDYIERVLPLPDAGHYTSDGYTDRDNLGKLLHIDASVQETFQTGLAIIAPLMATLLSILLPAPK